MNGITIQDILNSNSTAKVTKGSQGNRLWECELIWNGPG